MIAAHKPSKRLGACLDDDTMGFKLVEETARAGQDFLEPCKHFKLLLPNCASAGRSLSCLPLCKISD